MRTTFRTRQPYADIFLECARTYPCKSPVKPVRFSRKMKTNKGSIGFLTGLGPDEDGLERKNPVIVALGDSVTAGHFESLMPSDPVKHREMLEQIVQRAEQNIPNPPLEITDARECYLEKFRYMLIDKYETTSVSTINAGIAGDNLVQMAARADRDVIRYQPDLVLINGSLNWDNSLGTTGRFQQILSDLVKRIKAETTADIILLTPNGDLPGQMFETSEAPLSSLAERVQAIREVAAEEQVCLADVYAVWEAAREIGCPWEELLANGGSHPGVEGHEVYAITLMKLMEFDQTKSIE